MEKQTFWLFRFVCNLLQCCQIVQLSFCVEKKTITQFYELECTLKSVGGFFSDTWTTVFIFTVLYAHITLLAVVDLKLRRPKTPKNLQTPFLVIVSYLSADC